jgi:CheY-like chemotaxis protein
MVLWQEHSSEVDLLLTDMIMPEGMTGQELAKRLQKAKSGLKVIICSGNNAEVFQSGGIVAAGIRFWPSRTRPRF